jgi:hypothetical protein
VRGLSIITLTNNISVSHLSTVSLNAKELHVPGNWIGNLLCTGGKIVVCKWVFRLLDSNNSAIVSLILKIPVLYELTSNICANQLLLFAIIF